VHSKCLAVFNMDMHRAGSTAPPFEGWGLQWRAAGVSEEARSPEKKFVGNVYKYAVFDINQDIITKFSSHMSTHQRFHWGRGGTDLWQGAYPCAAPSFEAPLDVAYATDETLSLSFVMASLQFTPLYTNQLDSRVVSGGVNWQLVNCSVVLTELD